MLQHRRICDRAEILRRVDLSPDGTWPAGMIQPQNCRLHQGNDAIENPIPIIFRGDSPLSAFQWSDLDSKAVDTARVLAADAVEKVGNGHPGTAISLAPVAYLLFNKVMRHDPSDEKWLGRDRFIFS